MKKWILKAIVQKLISYTPFPHQLNFFFQKYITKGVYLTDEYFYDRLAHAAQHIGYYKQYSGLEYPSRSLEIGTGWYPVVPISLFLIGGEQIYSIDISSLITKERLATTLQKVVQSDQDQTLHQYIRPLPERIAALQALLQTIDQRTLEDCLSQLNIQYLIEDARKISLADNSIDMISSNNTFEHIYPDLLWLILSEFQRVVKKPGGLMSHFIDMSDHFAHFDRSITIYNFLRFSDTTWASIDNSIQPQSRLRFPEYLALYQALQIPVSETQLRAGDVAAVRKVPLAKKYRSMPEKSLAVSHAYVVSSYAKASTK